MDTRFLEQSTTCPSAIGSNYNIDIIRRAGQYIFAVRENVTSFSFTKLISDEKKETLKRALLVVLADVLGGCSPTISVRVDPGTGWRSLAADDSKKKGIRIELGYEKVKNKNSIVDKSISELHSEINRIHPYGSAISDETLAEATANMNSRIRGTGLSAKEMWFQRDQYTGQQLPIEDLALIKSKYSNWLKSHATSAKSQARGKVSPLQAQLKVGDLVYLNSERDKTKPRDRYVVVDSAQSSENPNTVKLQKFAGSQMRSRVYTVNRGDVITVQTHRFPQSAAHQSSEDSDTSEETEDVHIPNHNGQDLFNDPQAREDQAEMADHNVETPTVPRRSNRRRRLPTRFKDFVTEFDEEDSVFADESDSEAGKPRRSVRLQQRHK